MNNSTREKHHSLAVSGQCSSGKSTLCVTLSKKLNWKHVDIGEEFKRTARLRGFKIEEFGSIPEPRLRKIDGKTERRLRTETRTIWDGRLVCYLARNNPMIFKVYCVADLEVRAERSAKRDKISLEEARRKVLSRDVEEAEVFERLYGFSNPYDERWVNLRLDTSYNSPEKLSKTVLHALFLS